MSSQFKREYSNLLVALITLTGIIIIVAVVGFFIFRKGSEIVQGEVDVNEFRVSSKVSARVLRLCKQEGDVVHVGDTLAVLQAPDVQAKLEQAQAAQSAAQAQSEKAVKGTRHEQIQGAYDMWQKAKAGVEIAVKTYNRVKNLNAEGVVPAQKLDEASAQRDAAVATERAAHSQYTMAVNGAQREDKETAAALVKRAKGAVAEVNSYIKETYLIASCDGEVSETYPQEGELVGSGAPIMSISIMASKWVTFNVREDLLSNIRMGQTFDAFVPALGNKSIRLKVYYMKDLGSFAAWKATKSTGQYDLKTFEVKARPVQYVDGLRPGMSVIINKKFNK